MNKDQWARVKELFGTALEIEPTRREAFLRDACGTDEALHSEVESLLRALDQSNLFPETPWHDNFQDNAGFLKTSVQNQLTEAQRVGVYEIVGLIGRGGMGAVYRARRADGQFEQQVAIKVVQDILGSSFGADRLRQESRILAGLDHPNIARLFDAGFSGEAPYFAMEYIDGAPIDKFCAQHNLSMEERLRLFLRVCDAVQFAHQKLVVHRDLKPDNILVTEAGVPKLLDFGIAKVLSEVPGTVSKTATLVMTPEYASPEQILGEPVSTATDIYSLGCVLYKLLTGKSPHQLQGASPAEAVKIICEGEIPDPRKVGGVPADAAFILGMALRKEPQRRYRSVEQFAGDVQGLLGGLPLVAGPDTFWYRYSKLIRRNWIAVTAIASVVLALGVGAGIARWQAKRAERRFAEVRQLADVFLFDFEKSIHNVPGTTQARQLVVKTALEYLQKLSQDAAGDPSLTREVATAYEKVGDIQGAGHANTGKTADAVRSYETAIRMRRTLKDSSARSPEAQLDLGTVLVKLAGTQGRTDDLDAAIRNCREAITVADALLKTNPDQTQAKKLLASAYLQLPFILYRRSQKEEAAEDARRGLELRQELAKAAPQDQTAKQELAQAYYVSGELQARLWHRPEAAVGYASALEINRQLVAEHPDDIVARRQLMIILARLSYFYLGEQDQKKFMASPSEAYGRESLAIAEQAAAADPANAEALSDVMATAAALGQPLSRAGKSKEAIQVMERGLRSATALVEHDPGNRENRLNLALSDDNMANFLLTLKDLDAAAQHWKSAFAIFEQLSADSPNDVKILEPYCYNRLGYGSVLAKQGDWEGALRAYRQGLDVAEAMAPRNPMFASVLRHLREARQEAEKHLKPAH
jgi:eukaryotic-like serine/threonine-protein kinase